MLKKKIFKFLMIPLSEKLVILETLLILGMTRIMILLLPFRRIAGFLEIEMNEVPVELNAGSKQNIKEVALNIQRMSRYTPWESKCLVQAISGLLMLKRRGLPSTLFLGMAKENDGKNLIAHAWLKCGEDIVIGNKERERFTVVTQFASLPRRKAI